MLLQKLNTFILQISKLINIKDILFFLFWRKCSCCLGEIGLFCRSLDNHKIDQKSDIYINHM